MVQKTPGAFGTTLSKSDLEEPYNINKYRSFMGRKMCYTTKVGPDMVKTTWQLSLHISHPVPEYLKALGHLI